MCNSRLLGCWVFALLFPLYSASADVGASSSENANARVVSLREQASVVNGVEEKRLTVSQQILPGQLLKTNEFGRLSVILPNQMLLKVAENTEYLYQGFQDAALRGELKLGKVWLRGQKQAEPFEVKTPTATAAIRGTEWFMEVKADGTTHVGVVDGMVEVSNNLGSVELNQNEVALVEPGKAPIKVAYITPKNAVNWTLNYFGLWAQADLARDGEQVKRSLEDARDAYYAGDLARAQTVLANSPDTPSLLAMRGFIALISGRDSEAEKSFLSATSQAPNWALPLAHLSLISLVRNDLERAEKRAQEAVTAESNSPLGHIANAYALKGQLKLTEAYSAAKYAVELAPNFDEALLITAQLALEMEQLRDAEDFLARVKDEGPLLGKKRTLQGFLELRKNDDRAAHKRFAQALAVEPDSPDAHLGLGISLFNENKPEPALDSILQATLLAPQVSAYQSYLSKAYAEVGRTSDAKQVIERAKRLDAKDPTPYLYQALLEQSAFQPGRAFLSLQEAKARNENRAVFRSRYLLDQDKSVLTGNLSQVYNELGFDHTATQEAARALEYDPTNQAAHRRQFFALQFDPRGYAQAASSERLLNNMFLPPTRSGVVVNEELLSPYQSTFDRPGVDPVFQAGGKYEDKDLEENRMIGGNTQLAAQLEAPLAFSIDVGEGYTDSSIQRSNASLEREIRGGDRETNELTGRSFVKWQPNPRLELFGEFRAQDRDQEETTEQRLRQQMGQGRGMLSMLMEPPVDTAPPATPPRPESPPPPAPEAPAPEPPSAPEGPGGNTGGDTGGDTGGGTGAGPDEGPRPEPPSGPQPGPPMTMPTPPAGGTPPNPLPGPIPSPGDPPNALTRQVVSDGDAQIYDFDTGLHAQPFDGTHGLLHFSYNRKDDTKKETTTLPDLTEITLRDDLSTEQDSWITQGAVWQRLGGHFFQIGGRYYDQDTTLDGFEDGGSAGPTMIRNGNDSSLKSGFLLDQYTGIKSLVITLGVNVDDGNFELSDGRENDKFEIGPSIGVAWEMEPGMYLRGAIINNAAGDRNERLQQTLIAGFPWQRLTLIEPFNDQQFFNLEYETYAVAYDIQLNAPLVYIGLEYEHDRQKTSSFEEAESLLQEEVTNNANRARLYVESLLSPQFSLGTTYRFDRFEFPGDTTRHSFGGGAAYFTDWGLAFKLRGELVQLINDSEAEDSRVLTLEPSLEGYSAENRMRVNLAAPFNDDGDYAVRLDFFWYLQLNQGS